MTSGDPDYFRKASIRAVVTELVERFTALDAAKKLIIERTLLLIMDNPEFDLSEPSREILPIVRQVALEHFQVNVDDKAKGHDQINEGHP